VVKNSLSRRFRPFLCAFLAALSPFLGAETAEGIFPRENENAAVPVWRQAPGGALLGLPSVQAGTVVAVMDGGHLKAYSLEGKPLWDYYAQGRLLPHVSRNREGSSYVCRTDGTLIAVNRSGRELWRLRPGPLTGPAVSGWDGRIFVPVEKKILCYTASGYLLWSHALERPVISGPFLTGAGGAAAALEGGDILELDPFGEALVRRGGENLAGIVPVSGGVLAFFNNGELRLFRPGPAPARNLAKLRGVPVGAVSRGGFAALLLASGQITCVSLSTGKEQWPEEPAGSRGTAGSQRTPGLQETHAGSGGITRAEDVALLWDERGIYVLSRRGATGFTPAGRRLWTLRISGASSIPVLGDEGTLFSGGVDWIIYAYRVENRTLPRRDSLYGPAPEGSYGLANPPPSPWAEDYFKFNETQMDNEMKRLAALIQSGSIGGDEKAYAAYLREIAAASSAPQTSVTHPPVHVRHRAEAARLLGYFGSRETIPFLAELFLKDADPVVKTAAAEAIGRIGTDPEGVALRAFAQTVTAAVRDEQILTAAAAAIGSLCRFSGPPLSDSGIKLLGIIERDFMPARARAQAKREAASLR
jgi:outer membrane protein assembly factor BamB